MVQGTSLSLLISADFYAVSTLQGPQTYPVRTTPEIPLRLTRPVLQQGGSFGVSDYLLSVGHTPSPPLGITE